MSKKSKKREVYLANILIGSAAIVQQQQQQLQSSSVTNETSSRSLPSFLPTSPDQTRPDHITAICEVTNYHQLLYSDRAGHLFLYQPRFDAVTQFLIHADMAKHPAAKQEEEKTSTTSTTTTAIPSSFSPAELAFRGEMSEKHWVPFCSLEPILELRPHDMYKGLNIGKEHLRLNRIDLIHPHSITRIEWVASNWERKHRVPQVVELRTIFTLPSSFTIVSTLPFPGVPVGYDIELGPFLFTQAGSGHIYLAQPNSTDPPTILLRDSELKALVPDGATVAADSPQQSSKSADGDGIAPVMCASAVKITSSPESTFLSTTNSLLVLSHGCIFRVKCNPLNFNVMKIKLLIGTSPHLTSSPSNTPPHPSNLFFRLNSSDYRLQEAFERLFILDRMEGSVAEFDRKSCELFQCIEPSIESTGVTVRKPFQGFYVLYQHIWLIDAAGLVVYDWTHQYADQLKYEFGGNQLVYRAPTRLRPLQGEIPIPPIKMKPPVVKTSHSAM